MANIDTSYASRDLSHFGAEEKGFLVAVLFLVWFIAWFHGKDSLVLALAVAALIITILNIKTKNESQSKN